MKNVVSMQSGGTPDQGKEGMFEALTELEACVSMSAGLIELLSSREIQDRSKYGNPDKHASEGILMLSQDTAGRLKDAFERVHQVSEQAPTFPEKSEGGQRIA
jgi:hypothetical protein